MKKTLLISLTLMIAVGLSACGKTQKENAVDKMVDKAVNVAENTGKKVDEKTKEAMKDMVKGSEEATGMINKKMDKMKIELEVSRVYKKCLKSAMSKNAAIKCFEKANKLAVKSGLADGSEKFDADAQFGDWSAERKAKLLKELDDMEEFITTGKIKK